jgi:hypothetical protein
MLRRTAMAVAETGWGKNISPVARQAVVRYSMEIGADPVRHIYVLGGAVYLNAAFWMEIVAANPKFVRSETRFIHVDPRATPEEADKRRVERVTYGAPEEAKGAAVVVLFYEGRGPFVGVNWAGCGKKSPNDSSKWQDPVGEAEPTKTAESRAYRRAAIKAEPAWFREHPRLQAAENVLAQGREIEERTSELRELGKEPIADTAPVVAPIPENDGEPKLL